MYDATAMNGSPPILALDDLATAWLPRRLTGLAAMPGLNNDLGSVQIEADIAAVKHPVFPPYSGGNEVTWLTLLNGRQLAQQVPCVEIRWRAFEVERRCEPDGWRLESRTALLPNQPGVTVQVTVTNTLTHPRHLSLGFLCSGRSMNTGKQGYVWSVPCIPTDVFSFTKVEGLRQTVTEPDMPAARCLSNDAGNGHNVNVVSPAPTRWDRERIPTWETTLAPGERFTVTLLATFHADRAVALGIAKEWQQNPGTIFALSRARWEELWTAAFTPRNRVFSGHMPSVESPNRALLKLYYNGVLTILTCRRVSAEACISPYYLTLWPRRGEGSAYLAWELNCTSGVLARLDPASLREQWLLLASAPWLNYQQTNCLSGEHFGWPCSAHAQSLTTSAFDLVRWAGDDTWLGSRIRRQARSDSEAGDNTEVSPHEPTELTGREALLQAVHAHREHHLPGKATVDFGSRGAYLECVTTYAHGTAGHTAIQASALKNSDALFGQDSLVEIEGLEKAVLDLYHPGAGYFDCEYPDGSRQSAANLYDISLVLRYLGERVPRGVVSEIAAFARRDLLTPTWAHCLSPTDVDVASGVRCDHQWAGCFAGWPPQFVLGLLRSGERGEWIAGWLEGVARVVEQGPFGQAYWAEDLQAPEAGAAAKCYDELTQGNHWVIGSGALFAEMILDGVCGLCADLQGNLTLQPGLQSWSEGICITNIAVHGKSYDLRDGRLARKTPDAVS